MMRPSPSRNKPSTTSRRRAERRGRRGERVAAMLLRLKGFRILEQRLRTPFGEIDLVAARGGLVAFVEVKTRGRGVPLEEGLGSVRQDRIVNAANYVLGIKPELAQKTLRFDVIYLAPGRLPLHIADAFQAEQRGRR